VYNAIPKYTNTKKIMCTWLEKCVVLLVADFYFSPLCYLQVKQYSYNYPSSI